MDPLAHTLIGASLAETKLRRMTPLAAATLIIGANLPDVDAVTYFIGRDVALGARRGWTHGVLAMAVLPVLLAGAMVAFDRQVRRRRESGTTPTNPRAVLLLAYVGVLTHPLLDWLNTYGIRLLMPFDGRWFYGDAVFIVDPWVWLLGATAVVFARVRSGLSVAAWTFLGVIATGLVISNAPASARVLWVAGVALIVGLRARGASRIRAERVAIATLAAVVAYCATMTVGGLATRQRVRGWLEAQGITPVRIVAGPMLANPFARDVIIVDSEHYHFIEVDWFSSEPYRISGPSLPVGKPGPVVDAALSAPEARGLRTWMRLPSYDVQETLDGYRVTIRHVRFQRTSTGIGPGVAVVDLDQELNPRSEAR